MPLRRGGSFGRLLENFAFLAALRRQGQIRRRRLDFVVQALNFREMPKAVEIARAFGFDAMHFQMIRNWGTFTVAEFDRHFIGSPDHPDYGEFLEVLRHPNLTWAGIDWSNLRRLYERANAGSTTRGSHPSPAGRADLRERDVHGQMVGTSAAPWSDKAGRSTSSIGSSGVDSVERLDGGQAQRGLWSGLRWPIWSRR